MFYKRHLGMPAVSTEAGQAFSFGNFECSASSPLASIRIAARRAGKAVVDSHGGVDSHWKVDNLT